MNRQKIFSRINIENKNENNRYNDYINNAKKNKFIHSVKGMENIPKIKKNMRLLKVVILLKIIK